ncbi:MAG TPA: 30S ribosomal protein S9 [Bacteroidales bacterium]|mgnify:CR=1 FL=1|jgi:small subunit ribosomal protein S9|nr:30S ribosomal protein S9 [Bacteroidales bacterium]MDD4236068.1 30S ribosomal protein S9 [Bacteroidales bacterium]MDY0160363.1 30S ribosomal protein S9 [Bacteroidales bacterium]HRW21400.1 30S ribosomal protein S9 [Bacteroidales bacterium]HXK81686.1 30S ribosomal protein S9 [Bacteroidales bacterium]
MDTINTIGRRKAAKARVYIIEGKGNIIINNKKLEEYFPLPQLQYVVKQAFETTETLGKFDVKANLDGGGINGQAEALRLGIARALVKHNPEYRTVLKSKGFLTRDSRVVERKKPGQPKARKKFQFSKR